MENKLKEERSEYIGLYVTPSLKKELDQCSENKKLQEQIIKSFFSNERSFLESEMKEIDESVIRYSAKLLTIRDKFQSAQTSYVEQIEEISNVGYASFNKIDALSNDFKSKIDKSRDAIQQINSSISKIDVRDFERMMNAIDRFNEMSDSQKEVIKMLIK